MTKLSGIKRIGEDSLNEWVKRHGMKCAGIEALNERVKWHEMSGLRGIKRTGEEA